MWYQHSEIGGGFSGQRKMLSGVSCWKTFNVLFWPKITDTRRLTKLIRLAQFE